MADVVIFEPNTPAQYLKSVNTPDYVLNPNAIINPDISAVKEVPLKYWKRLGDSVVEMTSDEKNIVNQAELQTRKSVADTLNVNLPEVIEALIKVINLRPPSGQRITKQEMITAIKNEIT